MNHPRNQFPHNFENPFVNNPSRLSQTSGSCTNTYKNDHQESSLQFHHQESEDSGVCSPPLWKNSPSEPLLNHRRSLSPNSRIQAITRGQREMMEMVKNMPESSYELSLRDLVEKQGIETQAPPQLKQESRKNERGLMRIESFEDNRVVLKMGIPFSLKSNKKKKKKGGGGNGGGRVSPKPEGGKGGEMEWWKKKFSGNSDSDRSGNSGGGSSSSGRSDGGRRVSGLLRGCWPFLQSRKTKFFG